MFDKFYELKANLRIYNIVFLFEKVNAKKEKETKHEKNPSLSDTKVPKFSFT
jgi:hypothetical protein